MSQIVCKYHHDIPARWVCRQCQINFCADCVHSERANEDPHCPVCSSEIESLGIGNIITPFWNRLPKFFSYPAKLSPLLFMLVIAALNAIISIPLVGFLLSIVLMIVFMKYAYVVLEHTAQGHQIPPEINKRILIEELELPFKQILLILAMVTVNFAIYDLLGSGIYFVSMMITVLSLPAAIMVLAIEHSFFTTLNILFVSKMIRRIGPSYFILCLFLFFLILGSVVVINFVGELVPVYLSAPAIFFVNMYFILIMFNMMGYVIYQYHEKLGYSIEAEEFEGDSKRSVVTDQVSDPKLRQFEILMKEGKVDDVVQKLELHVKNSPSDYDAREMYHKLLKLKSDKQRVIRHGADYISRLLLENKSVQAIQIFVDCHSVYPGFKLQKANQRYEMAKLLRKNQQSALALSLLNNLHKDHPNYEGLPEAYLFASQIMCEHFGEDVKAKKILNFLLNKYPDHILSQKIKDYLQMVENLSQTG